MNTEQILLTLLLEQCNVFAQQCSKAIMFGMQEKQIEYDETNSQRMVHEFNGLLSIANNIYTGIGNETLFGSLDEDLFHTKQDELEKILYHSESLGILESQDNPGHE